MPLFGSQDNSSGCLKIFLGFLILTLLFYSFSYIIPEEIDWRILLAVNPDHPIPVLDGIMVFITDFSIPLFGLVFVCWEIVYLFSRRGGLARRDSALALRAGGIFFASLALSAAVWSGYDRPFLFIPLSLSVLAAFWIQSYSFIAWNEREREVFHLLFWVILLSVVLNEISAEVIIKNAVARARPFAEAYVPLNSGLRKIPGEVVESGYSYVAGHSSAFFAMVTPLMWYVSRMEIKVMLFLWAIIHALSRVYLAAHFPFCSLMGSGLGFLMAAVVIKYSGISAVRAGSAQGRC